MSFLERQRGTLLALTTVVGAATMIWLDARRGSEHTGEPLPPLTLHALDGAAIALDSTRGKPLVLDFWATWCGPCRRSLPALDRLAETHEAHARILAVNAEDEPVDSQRKAREELGLRLPMLVDGARASGLLHVDVLPTTIVVDREGRIAAIFSGAGHEDDVEAALKRLE